MRPIWDSPLLTKVKKNASFNQEQENPNIKITKNQDLILQIPESHIANNGSSHHLRPPIWDSPLLVNQKYESSSDSSSLIGTRV